MCISSEIQGIFGFSKRNLMSNAVSMDLLGENDVSKIYLVDSQSLGQKHCLSRTKVYKSKRDN